MPTLVYTILILNIMLGNIFFPLGKTIEMVRLRTIFILSSQSWEIGSPTGSAARMKLSCPMLATFIYILKKDPPPQCELCQCIQVRHILVECNHLAQTRNNIFGRRDVANLHFLFFFFFFFF